MAREYLKISEVADMLRVKDETVRRWIRNKKMKSTKINGRYLVKQEFINEFTMQRYADNYGLDLNSLKNILQEEENKQKKSYDNFSLGSIDEIMKLFQDK